LKFRSLFARELQGWRLSDLTLLHTFEPPRGPRGDEAHYTAEPRVLSNGRTVVVTTSSWGIHLLGGLEGEAPCGRLMASFPRSGHTWCAIPGVRMAGVRMAGVRMAGVPHGAVFSR